MRRDHSSSLELVLGSRIKVMGTAKRWISPRKYAELFGTSESTVRRWCNDGLLEHITTSGGHRRISVVANQVEPLSRKSHFANLLSTQLNGFEMDGSNETSSYKSLCSSVLAGELEPAWTHVVHLLSNENSVYDFINRCFIEVSEGIEEAHDRGVIGSIQYNIARTVLEHLHRRLGQSIFDPIVIRKHSCLGAAIASDSNRILVDTLLSCSIGVFGKPIEFIWADSLEQILDHASEGSHQTIWIALRQPELQTLSLNVESTHRWSQQAMRSDIVLVGTGVNSRLVQNLDHAYNCRLPGDAISYYRNYVIGK